jgi:two-component system chemotaxis sensor kinase CheA
VDDDDAEIIEAFLEESRENLDQLDRDLVELEQRPADPDLLAQIFRTIHTIKGTCGFLGYAHLEALSHSGESLLGALRAGDLALDESIVTSMLALVDTIREVLGRIAETGSEGDDDHAPDIAELERLRVDGVPEIRGGARVDAIRHDQPGQTSRGETTGTTTAASAVHVDVADLDKLMDLVGELVLARGEIGELALDDVDGPLTLPYRRLRIVTGELQDRVMHARLQTVGTVTGKFRRVARDLATGAGKQVRVEIDGEDVGVDKAVNESLRDPLLHLVRNAVDHAIERPAERIAAGKSSVGLLRIRAFHEGGRVQVEVSDDGSGVDTARLVSRAVASGMITTDEADRLSPRDTLDLMFRAGLSTKDEVTTLSGRGVGMDVVRSGLEQVGGSIDVESEPGRGTTFRISVPLSLSVLPALVAWCGGERYAIPQIDVREVVQLDRAQIDEVVHDVGEARIFDLRGRLLVLVDLAEHLGLPASSRESELVVVVVESSTRRLGLVVDRVANTTEAVVKPMPLALRSIPTYAGVTILSDGHPILVLDVAMLLTTSGMATDPPGADDDEARPTGIGSSLLVARGVDGRHVALALSDVRRLERFDVAAIEHNGDAEVVQYRDGLLPLVRVDEVRPRLDTPRRRRPDATTFDTVVCESSIGPIGLVVDRVEDIVDEPSVPTQAPSRRGVLASYVVDDRVTELLDVEALLADAGLVTAS